MSLPRALLLSQKIRDELSKIQRRNNYYTDAGLNVFFMRQWFDFRDEVKPSLSYFLLEESLLEQKGCSHKQELAFKVEAYIEHHPIDNIFLIINDIKRSLLNPKTNLLIHYQGYEINLPEEGSKLISAVLNFKIQYVENIH